MALSIPDEKCGCELWTRIWQIYGLGKGPAQTLPDLMTAQEKAGVLHVLVALSPSGVGPVSLSPSLDVLFAFCQSQSILVAFSPWLRWETYQ